MEKMAVGSGLIWVLGSGFPSHQDGSGRPSITMRLSGCHRITGGRVQAESDRPTVATGAANNDWALSRHRQKSGAHDCAADRQIGRPGRPVVAILRPGNSGFLAPIESQYLPATDAMPLPTDEIGDHRRLHALATGAAQVAT